jgi:protease-4
MSLPLQFNPSQLARPWACVAGHLAAVMARESAGTDPPEATIDQDGFGRLAISGGLYDYQDAEAEFAYLARASKGVLIEINSPGGLAYGCGDCASLIASAKVPVAVAVGEMAASAAYYLAASADRIFAARDSIVGSVGVIIPALDMSGLWEAMGIAPDYVVSGDLKATGYPPALTEDQRASLQAIVDGMFSDFAGHVEARRGISEEVKRGGIYTGAQGIKVGLVDQIGGKKQALAWLKKSA